jgi:protein-disulfide isomerase
MPTVDDDQDLTRKQRREAAREERKQAELAAQAADKMRTRLMLLGGALGAVIVIVVVILLVTGGSKKSTLAGGHKGSAQETTLVGEVSTLLNGIPESGKVLGRPTAPVTLQYFGDLECPFCREFSLTALRGLIEKYVRTGKLRIEYRSLRTATHEPETFRTQQIAALAAGKQNRMWYYIEFFYHEQGTEDSGYVTEEYLRSLAQQVPGLNLTAWIAARNSPELVAAITSDEQAANSAGFSGTPSFLIGRTGGAFKELKFETLTDAGVFAPAIEQLAKA